jgi:hypothetical protein
MSRLRIIQGLALPSLRGLPLGELWLIINGDSESLEL